MADYTVYIWPEPWKQIKTLPGNIRQRLKRAIDKLGDDPKPSQSKLLVTEDDLEANYELWRLRIEKWRVVYVICEQDNTVDVLTVRKRPPYKYEDLAKLLEEYSSTMEE